MQAVVCSGDGRVQNAMMEYLIVALTVRVSVTDKESLIW
jgi:hypothetical protein